MQSGVFDAASCHEVYPTPFWLLLPSAAREHVAEFATSEPRLLFDDEGKPYLALPIRSGVERGDIIKDVVDRCRLVADKLKTAPAAAVPDVPRQQRFEGSYTERSLNPVAATRAISCLPLPLCPVP